MNPANLKQVALAGFAWQMLEKIGVNGIQFLIYIVLARLLTPKDFGIIALITAFISITDLLVNSGLGTALVQKSEIDEEDYLSIFYTSVFLALIFYFVLFIAAPIIAAFYNEPIIVMVLRTYAISSIFFAINGVQRSILQREMNFKRMFFINTIPVIISGIVAVVLAYTGWGVFSLVFNAVFSGFLSAVSFRLIMKWRPKLLFNIKKVKNMFSFGYKLLLANLLETANRSLFQLIVGKVFNNTTLGYYNNGRQIPSFISISIYSSINSVMFPIYSRSQNDINQLKSILRQSICLSNFIIFPIMGGLAAVAEPLVKLFLTDKWLPCVTYLQLFCVVYGLYHLQNINFMVISALGRTDIFLRYEIFKKIIGIVILLLTIRWGALAIALGQAVVAIISIIINLKPNIKWLDYSFSEQFMDIAPTLLLTIIMACMVQLVKLFALNTALTLIFQILAGIVIYIGLASVFKMKAYTYFLHSMTTFFSKLED